MDMVVGIKDAVKLIGISIIACCAVFVCTMFLNFNMDIAGIREEIVSEQVLIFYEAQISTAKVVSMVSGGCLLITSVIMLIFYIKHYIAKNFWVFGISVLTGAMLGFVGAFLIMPSFYETQNEDKILPEITIHFHPSLFLCLVILPTVLFAVLAVCYAFCKLKKPVIHLLKDNLQTSTKMRRYRQEENTDCRFIDDLKKNTLKAGKLLFFSLFLLRFVFLL
jgi:hypothetical protein